MNNLICKGYKPHKLSAYEEMQFLCLHITKFRYFYLIDFMKISNWELLLFRARVVGFMYASLYFAVCKHYKRYFGVYDLP